MSETKHTPGPWKVGGLAGGNDGLRVETTHVESTFLVAVVTGYIDRGRRRANADLIAAAPELLAALKNIVLDADRDYKKAEHLGDKIGMLNAKHMRVIAWRAVKIIEPDFL